MDKRRQRIRELMNKRGFTYRELAEKTNIPSSVLQRYVSGKTNKMSIDYFELIAAALGVSPGTLMGWKEEQHLDKSQDCFTSKNSQSLSANVSSHEYELIKKYRLLSAKEQAVVDNLIDGLALTSSDNTVKTKSNSKTIEKLGVNPTPENGFISHKDMVGKGIAAFGGNKKKTKF